jgi:hypothetical protein
MFLLSKKIEVGCGIATAFLGIFIYSYVLNQDVAMYRRLNQPVRLSMQHVVGFCIIAAPSMLVAIGACAHALKQKSWALKVLWAGVILSSLLIILFFYGFAVAFNHDALGITAVLMEFVLAIVTLITAYAHRITFSAK